MATTLLKHVGQSILPLAPSPLKQNSASQITLYLDQSFILSIPGDQWLSQWGLGQGTLESAFLSPTKEAQLKFPGG
jgi:hypothetical protein